MPLLGDFDDYRSLHAGHHSDLNTEDDPEFKFRENLSKMPGKKKVLQLASMITGLVFLRLVYQSIFKLKTWEQKTLNIGLLLIILLMVIVGCYLNFYPAIIMGMYWLIPLATWGLFINYIRALGEHYAENEFEDRGDVPPVFRTRVIINSWFDKLFVTTRGINYHLCHHLFPRVPFYNLPKLQRELNKSEVYCHYSHINTSYYQVIWEHLTKKRIEPTNSAPVSEVHV